MEQFNFYLDTPIKMWARTHFTVEADTEEQAKEEAVKLYKNGSLDDIGWELLDDTIDQTFAESELFTEDGSYVYQTNQ
jgi:hypothetical protein